MSSPSTLPAKQNNLLCCLILVGVGMVALVATTIAAMVFLTGALLLFTQQSAPTPTASTSIAASGRMKGYPNAVIEFTVWTDFQ